MGARTKSGAGGTDVHSEANSELVRRGLRYRFAELLLQEHFDQALDEALVSYSRGQILRADMAFVVGIVKAAEQMGRTKLDLTRIPADLLEPQTQGAALGHG